VLSSIADLVVVSLLAIFGILMAPLTPLFVAGLLALVIASVTMLDFLKYGLFRCFDLH